VQALEDIHNAIKSLSLKEQEKTKLFALTTQVRLTLGDVKGEIRKKLGS
jgi:hypothetical protein